MSLNEAPDERALYLKPAVDSPPRDSRENEILSPVPGVVFYNGLTNKPADKTFFSMYSWVAEIKLLYEEIYPGNLRGKTIIDLPQGSHSLIFGDVFIDQWGYDYILSITVTATETKAWENLTCLIGPFNVDMVSEDELPIVESDQYQNVNLVFDGDYSEIENDTRRFSIFFLNAFGRKYSKVKWRNVTLSEGSVAVEAVITGLAEDLEETSRALEKDVSSGTANLEYTKGQVWTASEISSRGRRLLQDNGGEQKVEESSPESGGLSVAWIAAIVINVILIALFISVVVYCYCKNRNQRRLMQSNSLDKDYRSNGDIMYVEKAAAQLKDKEMTALNGDTLYHEDENKNKHGRGIFGDLKERCTCTSPQCYCSVGDEEVIRMNTTTSSRRLEQRFHEEQDLEVIEPSFQSPEPEKRYVTPQPIYSPEPADFWRPDSEQEQEEEEEEEAETFVPGSFATPPPPTPPEPPREKQYLVYKVTDTDGSRDNIGHLTVTGDVLLSDLRKHIQRDINLATVIDGKAYAFLNEDLQDISKFQESSLDLDQVYPYQAIHIKYIKKKKPTRPRYLRPPKLPAYVGPLGICSAPDCVNPSRIKCLDCGNTAYCSTKCMKKDLTNHKKMCYKPPWRI